MSARKYFPLGKAHGVAFCNRIKESSWLKGNILAGKHSLLVAPRRYGKSSLAEKAILLSKLPSVKINFHLCTTAEEVSELLTKSIINLIGKSVGSFDKLITSIKKYTENFNPKLTFGNKYISLELEPIKQANQAIIISETLLLIEKLLKEKNQKAVLFLDEFQEITKINTSTNIEGAIRTAAQEMEHLSIIFSGSIRSLLLSMFENENRPLYKLCRKLKLKRISSEDYIHHINKIATKTWGNPLTPKAIEEILKLSQRHPYYVNYLCDILWSENKTLPDIKAVTKAWQIVIEEEWSDAVRELSQLPMNQRKLLKFIASNNSENLTSRSNSEKLGLPVSTISSTASTLIEKDYIEANTTKHYKIISPLITAVLTETDYEG